LENIARDFDKLIKGFFYQVEFALRYTHVKGDRQVLNSTNCFSYPRYMGIEPKNCSLDQDEPMARFARFLAEQPSIYDWPKPSIAGDFINKSLKDYLISLRGYEIYPQCLLVTEEGKTEPSDRFVFLKVKHKNKENLGFQDVGSGISYVFPILSSLWQSKLSFIEQPELHLNPSIQQKLAEFFLAMSKTGRQLIVETHSEYLVTRLRLAGLKQDADQDLYKLLFVEKNGSEGTIYREVKSNSFGEIQEWPKGFFDQATNDIRELMIEISKRKIGNRSEN
jgi:hypothetical protein